jgi:hypothetical protein
MALSTPGIEFVKCALGGMAASHLVTGIPDKFSGKTVTFRFRQAVTLTAGSSGNLYVYCVPSPLGGLAIGTENTSGGASFETGVYNYTSTTYAVRNFNTGTGTSSSSINYLYSDLGSTISLLPYLEWQVSSLAPYNASILSSQFGGGGIAPISWRPLSCAMKVSYIGTTNSDSGYIATTRFPIELTEVSKFIAAGTQVGADQLVQIKSGITSADGISTIATADGGMVVPLRDGVYVQNVHDDEAHPFRPILYNSVPVYDATSLTYEWAQLAVVSGSSLANWSPVPGYGGMTGTAIGIGGMVSGQSVLVEQESCIEFTLAPARSFMAKLSHSSPTHDERALDIVANVEKCLPSAVPARQVDDGSWMAKVEGFISGGARALNMARGISAGARALTDFSTFNPFAAGMGGYTGMISAMGRLALQQ